MRWNVVMLLLLSGTTTLEAQDTATAAPKTSYSAMYERFAPGDGARASAIVLRWNRWRPGMAAFEGGIGLFSTAPGAILGEAGGVYPIGDRGAVLLLRGGVSMIAIAAPQAGVVAPVGAYGGVALVLGTGNTNLRLEIARHEYFSQQDNFGGWMLGVGLAFTPRTGTPTGKDR